MPAVARVQVADYARLQARLGREFLSSFGAMGGVTWGWYITNEGSLQEASTPTLTTSKS